MAGLKTLLAVVVILTTKDEAFSCPTRSHKAGSHPSAPSFSDSHSNSHHSSTTMTSCNTASGSSSGPSSLSNSLTLPSKSILTPNTLLRAIPPTPHAYPNNNVDLMNILTKLLSSPSNVASHASETSPAAQFTLPDVPGSNTVRGPVKIPKPHTIHPSHAKLLGAGHHCTPGTASGVLNELVPLLMATPRPSQGFPFPVPALNATDASDVSGDDPEHRDATRPPSPSPADLPSNTPKAIPPSQLCAQLAPASNKSCAMPAVPDSTSPNQSHPDPASDAYGCQSGAASPGQRPCDRSSDGAPKAPGPPPVNGPPAAPDAAAPDPASNSSAAAAACGGRNKPLTAITNLVHRRLSSARPPKAPRPRPPLPLPPTPPLPLPLPPVGPGPLLSRPAFPTPNAAVSSGYNPAFMQLLVDRLMSDPNSSLPSLSSTLPCLRPPWNVATPAVSPAPPPNAFQTSAVNRPVCGSDTNSGGTLNATSSDKPPVSTVVAPAPTATTPPNNTSLCNNPAFTNMLCRLLFSSPATPKTHPTPWLSPSNAHSTSPVNTTSVSPVI